MTLLRRLVALAIDSLAASWVTALVLIGGLAFEWTWNWRREVLLLLVGCLLFSALERLCSGSTLGKLAVGLTVATRRQLTLDVLLSRRLSYVFFPVVLSLLVELAGKAFRVTIADFPLMWSSAFWLLANFYSAFFSGGRLSIVDRVIGTAVLVRGAELESSPSRIRHSVTAALLAIFTTIPMSVGLQSRLEGVIPKLESRMESDPRFNRLSEALLEAIEETPSMAMAEPREVLAIACGAVGSGLDFSGALALGETTHPLALGGEPAVCARVRLPVSMGELASPAFQRQIAYRLGTATAESLEPGLVTSSMIVIEFIVEEHLPLFSFEIRKQMVLLFNGDATPFNLEIVEPDRQVEFHWFLVLA